MGRPKVVLFAVIIVGAVAAWLWMGSRHQAALPRAVESGSPPQERQDDPLPQRTEGSSPSLPAPPQGGTIAGGQTIPSAPLPRADKRDLGNPLAPASFPTHPTPRPADSDPKAAEELDKVALMLRDYRTLAGENPVGTNAEIMKAMMGDNPRGAKLGPPEGMSLDREGQLLDGWGTPIFFHQLSKDLMEIQSAGPDRRLGTEDDLILK